MIHQPEGLAVLVSYFGAGLFYTTSDLLAAGWPEELPPWARVLAVVSGSTSWLFVCLRKTRSMSRVWGWQAGISYFAARGAPAIALLVGGVMFAAVVV